MIWSVVLWVHLIGVILFFFIKTCSLSTYLGDAIHLAAQVFQLVFKQPASITSSLSPNRAFTITTKHKSNHLHFSAFCWRSASSSIFSSRRRSEFWNITSSSFDQPTTSLSSSSSSPSNSLRKACEKLALQEVYCAQGTTIWFVGTGNYKTANSGLYCKPSPNRWHLSSFLYPDWITCVLTLSVRQTRRRPLSGLSSTLQYIVILSLSLTFQRLRFKYPGVSVKSGEDVDLGDPPPPTRVKRRTIKLKTECLKKLQWLRVVTKAGQVVSFWMLLHVLNPNCQLLFFFRFSINQVIQTIQSTIDTIDTHNTSNASSASNASNRTKAKGARQKQPGGFFSAFSA